MNVPTGIFTAGAALLGLGSVVAAFSPVGSVFTGIGGGIWVGHHVYTRIRTVRELGVDESGCASGVKGVFCRPCSSVQLTDTLAEQGQRVRLFTQ